MLFLLRRRWQRLVTVSLILTAALYLIVFRQRDDQHQGTRDIQQTHPLLWKHLHWANGTSGAWYIPPNWLPESEPTPRTIIDAVRLAFQVTNSTAEKNIPHSSIPLIVHQTWKNTRIDTWPKRLCDCVEKWLEYSEDDSMAYFLWDDDGVMKFLEEYEPSFVEPFTALAANVERSDVFRILVASHIGGVYGDIDTYPLRSPKTWIAPSDLTPWTDPETGFSYNFSGPVKAMFGIEADCPPDTDSYWRLGYTNPIQLTQWALASSPSHPILLKFMDNLSLRLREVADHHGGNLKSPTAYQELKTLDPLLLTGPDAITVSARSWLREIAGLRWNSLTGLYDGGRSKLVDDVIILPITGFSPGRSTYGNMGSKPITDPSARLLHHAQGTWRIWNPRVEFGRFCRTFFGLCKDWSKV